jgi:hypothetical protein
MDLHAQSCTLAVLSPAGKRLKALLNETNRSAQTTNRSAPQSRNPTPHEYEVDARIQEPAATRERFVLPFSPMEGVLLANRQAGGL